MFRKPQNFLNTRLRFNAIEAQSVFDYGEHVCHVGPWGERNVVVVTPFEVAAGQLVMHLERLVGGETEVAKLHMHDGLVRVVAVKVHDHNHRVCLAGAGQLGRGLAQECDHTRIVARQNV